MKNIKSLKYLISALSSLCLSGQLWAEVSMTEQLQQAMPKMERVENCEVREDIARNALPSTPHNMSLPEFGQGIIGWGTGPEGAMAKIQNLHLSDIEKYQQQGITLVMLQEWQAFYQNETTRNSCNPTAPLRASLMGKIISMW